MKTISLRNAPLALAIGAIGFGTSTMALAFNFETEGGVKVNFDSTISYGVQRRMKSPDPSIIANENGGNVGSFGNAPQAQLTGNVSPNFNYLQADDGNLNYKKGDIVSQVLKGTHELGLKEEGNWAALARVTWSSDFSAAKTRRTPLDDEAKKAVQANASILDFWVSKDFNLGENAAKVKIGNQVLSWGEDIFIIGGINTINAVDLRKAHIPGTQVKEILLPAPIISFSSALGGGFSTEAYYQMRWNKLILDPAGTYWSSADFLGKGGKRGAWVSADFGVAGAIGDFNPNIAGRDLASLTAAGGLIPVELSSPKNSGQYGINLRYKPSGGDTEYAGYYIRYHDKMPFVGFKANGTGSAAAAVEQYAEDRELYGLSMNTKVGDWAVGAEISYRPRDSVMIDPSVPTAAGPYSLVGVATGVVVNGYKAEKKWQAQMTGFKLLPQSITAPLGAAEGAFLFEAAVTRYPGLDLSGAVPYLLNNYTLPTKTSWGYVAELSLTYANVFNSGWTMTPIVDWFHDVKGTSPNTLPFVEGRKALAMALNFDYHNKTKIGIGYTTFSGGGNLNMMRDRDVLSASLSYAF
jgi:hypothetical protein